MDSKNAEIVFPHEWEYRIFCLSSKCSAAETAIRALALNELKLEQGATSGSGSYKTIRISSLAASKEEANKIGEELKKLDGVRFIL